MIQIFGFKNCNGTKAAQRFFKERGVKFQFVNMDEKAISPGELKSVLKNHPEEDLLDRDGKEFKRLQLQYMKFDILEKLQENPRLLKTPIVRSDGKSTIGINETEWKNWC